MSKKYKLKKWYPGLPKEWKKLIPTVVSNQQGDYYFFAPETTYIKGKIVENNPEFWEPVVEKDYEILSFKVNGFIYERKEKGINKGCYFREGKAFGYEEWLGLQQGKIHSVKRLSDGEVFTVGDKMVDRGCSVERTITSFIINDDGESISVHGKHDHGTCCYSFSTIHHQKPLFTTYDGVGIFEGDRYSFVNKEVFGHVHTLTAVAGESGINSDLYVYFSTKAKARKYIADNKVLFTTEDNVEMFEGEEYYAVDPEKWEAVWSIADEESLNSDWKRFHKWTSAIKYILNNKPRFSLSDIANTAHRAGHIGFNNRDQRIGVIVELEEFLKELRKL